MNNNQRLVVVSNRVPPTTALANDMHSTTGLTGGLVSALKPVMEAQGGLWFGWSGKSTERRPSTSPTVTPIGPIKLATIDLSVSDVSLFYTGFANRTLWPLLHSMPERMILRPDTYRAYRRANQRFAQALFQMLRPGDLVWIHDYHLFHLGQELRKMGWQGKIGFFLHVPFPPQEIFAILPWENEILRAFLSYNLVGVHTEGYLQNLQNALISQLGGSLSKGIFACGKLSTRLGVYPIGIDPTIFQQHEDQQTKGLAQRLSIPRSTAHSIILGVDRLDYTKGIPERLMAFERLLEHHPSLRSKVSFVQISSPSRRRVPEYIQEKERVDQLVGHINGRFSEEGWVPVRYLYRSHSQQELARFYHDAHVCMVTPLRDGMNLVAKEFVASQGNDPGVLVLSKFTGSASFMREALHVNPYDIDGTAKTTFQALQMPLAERRHRWKELMKVVCKNTARHWSRAFLSDLARS